MDAKFVKEILKLSKKKGVVQYQHLNKDHKKFVRNLGEQLTDALKKGEYGPTREKIRIYLDRLGLNDKEILNLFKLAERFVKYEEDTDDSWVEDLFKEGDIRRDINNKFESIVQKHYGAVGLTANKMVNAVINSPLTLGKKIFSKIKKNRAAKKDKLAAQIESEHPSVEGDHPRQPPRRRRGDQRARQQETWRRERPRQNGRQQRQVTDRDTVVVVGKFNREALAQLRHLLSKIKKGDDKREIKRRGRRGIPTASWRPQTNERRQPPIDRRETKQQGRPRQQRQVFGRDTVVIVGKFNKKALDQLRHLLSKIKIGSKSSTTIKGEKGESFASKLKEKLSSWADTAIGAASVAVLGALNKLKNWAFGAKKPKPPVPRAGGRGGGGGRPRATRSPGSPQRAAGRGNAGRTSMPAPRTHTPGGNRIYRARLGRSTSPGEFIKTKGGRWQRLTSAGPRFVKKNVAALLTKRFPAAKFLAPLARALAPVARRLAPVAKVAKFLPGANVLAAAQLTYETIKLSKAKLEAAKGQLAAEKMGTKWYESERKRYEKDVAAGLNPVRPPFSGQTRSSYSPRQLKAYPTKYQWKPEKDAGSALLQKLLIEAEKGNEEDREATRKLIEQLQLQQTQMYKWAEQVGKNQAPPFVLQNISPGGAPKVPGGPPVSDGRNDLRPSP